MAVKVCHMTCVHLPIDTRIVLKECVSLLDAGYEVFLVYLGDLAYVADGRLHYVCAGQQYNTRRDRMTKGAWRVYQAARKIDADIYHFHDPELIPLGLLLKLDGKKVIYDVHENLPEQIMSKRWITPWFRRGMSIFASVVNKIADYFCDWIVAAVPDIAIAFKETHTFVINNYPWLNELHSRQIYWSEKKVVFCYVGGLSTVRGINEMVASIGKTAFSLCLAGRFEDPILEANVKMAPNVKYHGFLDRKQIRQLYRESVCGLVILHPISNYLNSMPVKMFEYMAAGIPFIASDFPYWRGLVGKINCGIFVDPFDVNAIAEAMTWIIEHPAEAEHMGKNGRRAIEEHFCWENEAKKLCDLYRKIL